MQTLRFSEKNDALSLVSKFVSQGVEVVLQHNSDRAKYFVSDDNLVKNIGEELYYAFNNITTLNKEKKSKYDFNKLKNVVTPVKSSVEYLQNYPTSSYIELWRTLKMFNAYSVILISTFDWINHQDKSLELIQEKKIASYIQKALEYISMHVSSAFKSLVYKLLETLRYVSVLYPIDKKINIGFGLDTLQSRFENIIQRSKQGFIIIIILLIVLIIFAILAYKKSTEIK